MLQCDLSHWVVLLCSLVHGRLSRMMRMLRFNKLSQTVLLPRKNSSLLFFHLFPKVPPNPDRTALPYLASPLNSEILTTFDQPAPASPLAASPISCVNSFRAVKLLVLNLAKCATTMGKTRAKRHPSMQSIPWCSMVRCCWCKWNVGSRWAKHGQTWPNMAKHS